MRYIKYAFLGGLAAVLVTLALANREMVTLRLLPEDLAGLFGLDWAIEMPLFLVILSSIAAGLLIGFVWEWLREARIRAEARRREREARELAREVRRLGGRPGATADSPSDEVVALIEKVG